MMQLGMMWFDNDNRKSLETKITEMFAYYYKKYSRTANLVVVHPTQLPENLSTVNGIEVMASKSVLPNNYWIGNKSENRKG